MIGGPGRLRPALLIELRDPESNDAKRTEILKDLWTTVLIKANEVNTFQGRVLKSLILIAPPRKPFLHANKGTVSVLRQSSYSNQS
jgi:hypothetical protein